MNGGSDGGMETRGVTRPMARQEISGRGDDDKTSSSGDDGGSDDGGEMSHDDMLQMLRQHHKATLWVYWTLPLLGLWTLTAPFT